MSRREKISEFIEDAYNKVPEIGNGWRWYDIPYLILMAPLGSKFRKFVPRALRRRLNYGCNYFMSFNEHERHLAWRRDDPFHNLKVPLDEHVTVPAIWVIELFPPSCIDNLTKSIERNSWDKGRIYFGSGEANREILQRSRTGQGWAWWRIGEVAGEGAEAHTADGIHGKVPPEFERVELVGIKIGDGLTAVLAKFRLSSAASRYLDDEWHTDHAPELILRRGRPKAEDRHWTSLRKTQEARRKLHDAARSWLSEACSGVFAADNEKQPLIDLLLIDNFDPTTEKHTEREFSDALRALGIIGFQTEHIYYSSLPGLLLEPVDIAMCPTFKNQRTWCLWGNRGALVSGIDNINYYGGNEDDAIAFVLHGGLRDFFALLAISEILRLFEGKYAVLRDASQRRHGRYKGQHLKDLRAEFLTHSLDVSSLVRDIRKFNSRTWRYSDDARFIANIPPWMISDREKRGFSKIQPVDMIEKMKKDNDIRVTELAAIDKDYRDVLSTVASLGSSIDARMVSRIAIWVSLASLLIAFVTLLVAEIKSDTLFSAFLKWLVSMIAVSP